jgi:glycine cleavage system transcriptional repressor
VRQIIVSAIGPDRPGIVGQLTGHLHDAGANVLDSRMVNLRGQFAIMVLLEAESAAADSLRGSLPALAREMGLALTFTDAEARPPAVAGLPFRLKTYSMDQPGIIHRVSDALRRRGVNIEDLATRQESAPFAGTLLFLMEMRLTIPPEVPISEIRAELQSLCDSLNCDLDFEPAER